MVLTFIAQMFLFTSYSANIVGLLQSPSKKIQNLQQLFESRLTMGLEDNDYYDSLFAVTCCHKTHYLFNIINMALWFQSQSNLLVKQIFQQLTNTDGTINLFSSDIGMAKVRNEYFSFYIDRTFAFQQVSDTFYDSEKCSLQIIRCIDELSPYIALPKHSPYYEILKTG